jgi:hypothetical protein
LIGTITSKKYMLYNDHFNDTDLDSLYPSDSILLYRVSRLRSVIEAGDAVIIPEASEWLNGGRGGQGHVTIEGVQARLYLRFKFQVGSFN